MSDVARRTLTHWSGPTALAVLLALLSLPLVAISLDAVHAPPRHLFRGDPGWEAVWLSLTDLGRWSAAAGAVLAAALIAGTLGGRIVRLHAKAGGLLTLLLAWEVAIVAVPLLPSLLHLDVTFDYFCIDDCGWAMRSSDPASGLAAAAAIYLVPFSALGEPVSFVLLLVGVVAWTVLLRRFSGKGPGTTPEVRAETDLASDRPKTTQDSEP